MHSLRAARGVTVIVTLVAVTLLLGSCCGKAPVKKPPSPVWTVEVTPVEDTNPTKTQHTFIATVFDREGRPLPNVQVHWILARTGDAVGDIVTYDDQDLGVGMARSLTRKTDNYYAVSYTNEKPVVLHAGMRWKPDPADRKNFQVLPGQTWCTITSPVEGDSHMIVFVPAIEDARCHKVFAIKHWRPQPVLGIVKNCPAQISAGDEFEYEITVSNTGDGTAHNVWVTDQLPAGVEIIDGTAFPYDMGDIGANESSTMRFKVRSTASPMDNAPQSFGVNIDANCTGAYENGDTVPITITVTNPNAEAIDQCVVKATIGSGVSHVDASGGDLQGSTVVFQVGTLPPGQTFQRTINGSAMHDPEGSGQHQVTAEVSGMVTVGGSADLLNQVEARDAGGQGEFYARGDCLTKVVGSKTSPVQAGDSCAFGTRMGVPSLRQELEDRRGGNNVDNFAVGEDLNYLLTLENEGQLRLQLDMSFTLTGGLEFMADQPAGLVDGPNSTTVRHPLSITPVAGQPGTFKVSLTEVNGEPVYLKSMREPGHVLYLMVPIRGTVETKEKAEGIEFQITWKAYDRFGNYLKQYGELKIGESTWIGTQR